MGEQPDAPSGPRTLVTGTGDGVGSAAIRPAVLATEPRGRRDGGEESPDGAGGQNHHRAAYEPVRGQSSANVSHFTAQVKFAPSSRLPLPL